ncbi:MAG: SusC/RagA family TonB-linked outer membrane protein [Bacteroidales bacterium]|nr:SusC/RagA family TonB-linked outer membrane protein [Bacteroidales bacterium]
MFASKKLGRFLAAACILILSAGSVWAQNMTVTGKVVDNNNEPIIGAYVVVEGTTVGTSTDVDGSYRINVPANGTLTFTCIGYKTQSVMVAGRSVIQVILADDAEMLAETVVTALGIKKEKKSLGYAVEDLSANELMKNKTANPISSLSGKIAGVNITQSSGAAGSGAQIILRGGTSAAEGKDNQPLFVVDGIIYDNSSGAVGNSAFDGTTRSSVTSSNRVMDINPEDIESMSVLKGPAASALYGSRAANGVVLITTKKGKEGAVEINLNSKLTTAWAKSIPAFQNQYVRGRMVDQYQGGNYIGTSFIDDRYDSWGEQGTRFYDNTGEFFTNGVTLDESVSVSGGTKTGNFYLSGSYFNQGGIVPNTGYEKYTVRFNGEQKYGIFTFGANVAYSQAHTDKTLTGSLYGSSGSGALTSLYGWAPSVNMAKWQNEDGTRYRQFEDRDPWEEVENPYWILNKYQVYDNTNRITGNVSVRADITRWWNITYRLGLDTYSSTDSKRIAPNSAIKQVWQKGMMSDNARDYKYLNNAVLSNMDYKFGDFDLGLLLGTSIDQTSTDRVYMLAYNFSVPEFFSYANTDQSYKSFSHGSSLKRLIGVFGEFRAAWKNTVFLTVTGRNDWTSTLPVENRSYFYPSVSGSVVFTQPLQDAGIIGDDILSFGKVRASWAKVGKDTGVYETATALWPVGTYLNGLVGIGNSWERGNPYLKPEMTRSTELGVELSFFKNRLHIDYAYYTNDSFNQILSPRGPQSTGYIFCSINAGNVYNKGQELSISATPVETRDFSWDIALNMAGNRGRLDGLPGGITVMYLTDIQYGYARAASFNGGNFMGIEGSTWNRVQAIEGSNSNKDLVGTVILDKNGMPLYSSSYQEVGNREAYLNGGLNNTFTWKGLSLNMLWEFRIGGDVYNGTQYYMDQCGTSQFSADIRHQDLTVTGVYQTGSHKETVIQDGKEKVVDVPDYEAMTHTWSPNSTYKFNDVETSGLSIIQNYYQGYYPRETANYLTKVNLLRLRSLSLTYQFPKKWMQKTGFIKNASVSVAGNNLFLLTNYDGDPEVATAGAGVGGSSSVGFAYCDIPSTSGMTFGLNLTF